MVLQPICHICKENFAGLDLLSEHYCHKHGAYIGCKLCFRQYPNNEEMDADFKTHLVGGLRMSCKYCLTMFGSVKKMQDHMDSEHAAKLRRLTCKECNYLACSVANFELHASFCPTNNVGAAKSEQSVGKSSKSTKSSLSRSSEDSAAKKAKKQLLTSPTQIPTIGKKSPKTPIFDICNTEPVKSKLSHISTGSIMFNCNCMGKPKFSSYEKLYAHGAAEHRRTFTMCMYCGLAVACVNDKDLAAFHKRHRTKKKHDGRPLFCMFCWKLMDEDENAVLAHIRLKHSHKSNCFCCECQTYFPSPAYLGSHRCVGSSRESLPNLPRPLVTTPVDPAADLMFTPTDSSRPIGEYALPRQRHVSTSESAGRRSDAIIPSKEVDNTFRKRTFSSNYAVPVAGTSVDLVDDGLDLHVDCSDSQLQRKRPKLDVNFTNTQSFSQDMIKSNPEPDLRYLNQLGQSLNQRSISSNHVYASDNFVSNGHPSASTNKNDFRSNVDSSKGFDKSCLASSTNRISASNCDNGRPSLVPARVSSLWETTGRHVPADRSGNARLLSTGHKSAGPALLANSTSAITLESDHQPKPVINLDNLPHSWLDENDDDDDDDDSSSSEMLPARTLTNISRSVSSTRSSGGNNVVIMYVCGLCKIESKYRASIKRHVIDVHRVSKDLWEVNCEAVERTDLVVDHQLASFNNDTLNGPEEAMRTNGTTIGQFSKRSGGKSKCLQVRMDCEKCTVLEEENRKLKNIIKGVKNAVDKLNIVL